MTEKLYAYAWFRRPIYSSPGNWKACGAAQMASVMKHLRHNKIKNPVAGEVLRGRVFGVKYDYLYVKTEIPATILTDLEEV